MEEEGTDEKEESMGLTRLYDVSAIEREGTELQVVESVSGLCVCARVCAGIRKKMVKAVEIRGKG